MRKLVLVLACVLACAGAHAQTRLRVGKDVPQGFPMVPLNVGMQTGIFARHGIAVDEIDFSGAAKMQAAMVGGALDVGIGGGPEMAYIAKGAPELAVAATSGAPVELGIAVPYDSPINTPAGLKSKRIWVSSLGGLSHWLVREFSRAQGWGPDGVVPAPLGGSQTAQLAVLQMHQVDAAIMLTAQADALAARHEARLLIPCSAYVHDFIAHALFATDTLMQHDPDALRRFLAGWFESVAWMRAHKAETVQIAMQVSGFSQPLQAEEYDQVMPTLSPTGIFERKALAVLQTSFVDIGMLDHAPDMSKLITQEFLPNRAP